MIKVSIIVPIFNAAPFLAACLTTLVNQTLEDIEIICILDAPTDGSEKIAEEFAVKDNRIKLIYNEKNLNVSESRNKGMIAAEGEYIGFSDHDDIRDLKMYELLYLSAKENDSDITFSDAIIRTAYEDKIYKYNNPTREAIIRSIILPMEHKNNENYLSKSVWSSIYRRKFISSNNVLFKDKHIYFSEDTLFNLKAFLTTKKISYVDKALYVWVKHESSLSNQWVAAVALKSISYHEEILKYLKSTNQFERYKKEWIISLDDTLNSYYTYFKQLSIEQKMRLGQLLDEGIFPFFSHYDSLKFISKKRLKLYMFVVELKLYYRKSKCN